MDVAIFVEMNTITLIQTMTYLHIILLHLASSVIMRNKKILTAIRVNDFISI